MGLIMSEGGFALIHRTLLGHPAFRNDAEAMAFAWMILRAAWRPTRVRYKDRPITLARGQIAVSVRDMANAMDRDKAWIERLFKRLKSETMIETVATTGVTVVTICNYDDFQAEQDSGKTQRETPDDTDARQAQDTEQIREKGNKERSWLARPREAVSNQPAGPSDFERKAQQIAEAIHLTRPIAEMDRAQLRQWMKDGLDFEDIVMVGVRTVTAREEGRGRSVSGFRYLDGGVRDRAAEVEREIEHLRSLKFPERGFAL